MQPTFYDNLIISTDRLIVPHPRIQERAFALVPLLDVASDLIHPIEKKSIQELYSDCTDEMDVKKFKQ